MTLLALFAIRKHFLKRGAFYSAKYSGVVFRKVPGVLNEWHNASARITNLRTFLSQFMQNKQVHHGGLY